MAILRSLPYFSKGIRLLPRSSILSGRIFPSEKGRVVEVSSVSINAKDLLPPTAGYYTFAGSLTTPPCTEGVTWYVLKTPVAISKPQLDAFAKIYKHDNRPIQPTNQREVLESK